MGTVGTLSSELYTQPEAFQRERRSVFGNAWLLLARADALARPGDYAAQSLGGWPVFTIADQAGIPAAFRNVCRHQKLPLFDTGGGHCDQIRCRYHGWTYDIAGRFLTAPSSVAPNGALSPDLERVTAQQIHGLLFVHLGDDPPSLEMAMPALAPVLAGARLEARGFSKETVTDIDANWKLVMEQVLQEHPRDVARTFEWPSLALDVSGDGVVVHQIIARSFHRTRIHHHHYGAASMIEWSAAQSAQWKASSLARWASLEAGAPKVPLDLPELEAFRGRVRAAHAGASAY
jgi:nitrite reductase/ring-hydroxylating ferredoxin subunit